ncbi:hypothetical protein ES708_32236 [subsurface metagenome]
MKKIAVVALKGGVGKSSVVAGLGLALVEKVFKVGLLDIHYRLQPLQRPGTGPLAKVGA